VKGMNTAHDPFGQHEFKESERNPMLCATCGRTNIGEGKLFHSAPIRKLNGCDAAVTALQSGRPYGDRMPTRPIPPPHATLGPAVRVCPFAHDHGPGDWSYDDCVAAFNDAKARQDAAVRQAQPAAPSQPKLIPGHRYRFVYRNDAQRKDHVSVLDCISETDSYFILNARPYAGTQEMPKRWVSSVTEVPKTTPLQINDRILRQ
jgi:hypothetical protein